MITVQLTGLDAIRAKLAAVNQNSIDDAMQEAADKVAFDTQNMPPVSAHTTGYGVPGIPVAPKYGGTLRQSVHSLKLGPLEYQVIADTDYSGYVHEGTSKMPARPFFEWVLTKFDGLKHIEEIINDRIQRLL
jgi:HK97 gp10 family phage protein